MAVLEETYSGGIFPEIRYTMRLLPGGGNYRMSYFLEATIIG